MARKHLVDVTEIFRQLSVEKKYRMIKLAFYFCLFIITIYRFDLGYILINILGVSEYNMHSFASANFVTSYSKTSRTLPNPYK